MVALAVMAALGLCVVGTGLWLLTHPFGANTDHSDLSIALDVVIPDSMARALQETYLLAQVRRISRDAACV